MSFAPAKSDERQLAKVHPDLVKVVRAVFATSPMPFRVLEGARTKEQQRKNIEAGVSWTMNSRHIPGRNGWAHAVDLVPLVDGQVTWDMAAYRRFAPVVKAAAASVGVPVEWGGDWKRTVDGPHWQLPCAPKYAAMGGPADDGEGSCGAPHPMVDSEGGQPDKTTAGQWMTAFGGFNGSGFGFGLFSGMEWMGILILMGGLTVIGIGLMIWMGNENRQKLWRKIVG